MQPLPLSLKDLELGGIGTPKINIKTWASVAYTVVLEGFTKSSPFRFQHSTTNDRVVAESTFSLDDIPIALGIGTLTNISRRTIYAEVGLNLGAHGSTKLLGGYLDPSTALAMGIFQPNVDRMGALRSVTGTDPAANVEISETVPTNAIWRLESIRFQLVTDANVADRTVQVVIDDGTTTLWTNRVHDVQQASETRQYNFGVEESYHATEDATGDLHAPLPRITLNQGYRIRTVTTNRQVTDNYGAPQIAVQEWLEE